MLDIGYRSILKMAIPLMGSSFIQSVVMITDSSFLSRYNTIAFDAAGNGGMIYITMFVVLMGLSDSTQIIMARRIGEKKEEMLPSIFGTALLSNLIITLLLFTFIQYSIPDWITWFTENQEIAASEIVFVQTRSFGLFFALISLGINAYFLATGKTYIVLISATITAISNIGLDYALIFGELGAPELGLKGAAIASTTADGVGMLFLTFVLLFNKMSRQHRLISGINIRVKSFFNIFKVLLYCLFFLICIS